MEGVKMTTEFAQLTTQLKLELSKTHQELQIEPKLTANELYRWEVSNPALGLWKGTICLGAAEILLPTSDRWALLFSRLKDVVKS